MEAISPNAALQFTFPDGFRKEGLRLRRHVLPAAQWT